MIFFSIFRETDNKYFSRTFTINLIPDLLKNRFMFLLQGNIIIIIRINTFKPKNDNIFHIFNQIKVSRVQLHTTVQYSTIANRTLSS